MPIVQVQLPDGRVVSVHAEPQTPRPNPLKQAGASLLVGFGKMASGAPKAAAMLMPTEDLAAPFEQLHGDASRYWQQFGDKHGFEPGYKRAIAEGAGGALVNPAGGVGRTAVVGAAAGGGAEAGGQLLDHPLGSLAGGVLAGGAAGFLAGPRQSVAHQDIRRELNHLTPADFQKAQENLTTLNAAGSKTATLVDAFEGSPRIKGLANRVQNERGGEALGQRTAGRVEDREQLGQALLNRISPKPVSESATANNVADAATGVLTRQKESRSAYMGKQLQGKTVAPRDSFDIFAKLHQAADKEIRKEPAEALRAVADSLVDQHGKIITDVQQLSLALKAMKDAPKNPNAQVKSGSAISDQDMAAAIRAAESLLKQASPDFARGNAGFASYSRNVVKPTREGPIGAMADKNPLLASPTPLSRIEGTLAGETPEGIERTLSLLQRPGYTGGPTVDAKALARALAQRKLDKLPQNPGSTMRGAEGSLDDQRFASVLRSAGVDPQETMQPLRAADLLKELGPAGTVGGLPPMRAKQLLLRPFRTIDMATSAQTEEKISRQIAELLARNDMAGLTKLQEIANFDPTARRLLIAKGLMQPAATSANTEGN
jgi:hypothetical protein